MLLKEITYDLLEIIREGHIVDNERISLRLLENWIHNSRAKWIKKKLNNGEDIDDNLLQNYSISLQSINTSLDTTLSSFKNILRTNTTIPALIETKYGEDGMFEVSSPDVLEATFSYIPFDQLRWAGNHKFNSKQLFVARREGYLYVKYGKNNTSPFTIKNIYIRGLFQNPTEVNNFDADTNNYPINRSLLDQLKADILSLNIRTLLQGKADESSDGTGDIVK